MKIFYRISLFLLWSSSALSYGLGLYFPILTTKSKIFGFTIRSQDVRLFDSINLFFNSKEYLLAGIIFLFTIIIPIFKYFELLFTMVNHKNKDTKLDRWKYLLDKWSMIDVFVVALIILNFKLNSSVIVMKLMVGTTCLAISIILRIGLVELIRKNVN